MQHGGVSAQCVQVEFKPGSAGAAVTRSKDTQWGDDLMTRAGKTLSLITIIK